MNLIELTDNEVSLLIFMINERLGDLSILDEDATEVIQLENLKKVILNLEGSENE
jgi:hypothetical protein